MMNKIVDSHCHLNFPQFKGKLDEIVKRALDKGIYRMLTISIKLTYSSFVGYVTYPSNS